MKSLTALATAWAMIVILGAACAFLSTLDANRLDGRAMAHATK